MSLPLDEQPVLSVSDLRHLAAVQEGVISRDQLLRAGYPPGFGRGKVRSGTWRRLFRGVYLTNSGAITSGATMWAALLAAPPGAVLGGATAAALDGWREHGRGPLELVVPHESGTVTRLAGVRVRRQRRPIQDHSVPPRTTIAATAIDLVQRVEGEDDVVAIITAAARRLHSVEPLARELARRGRCRHRSLVAQLLTPGEAGHESTLEWRFTRRVIRAHGLPEPIRQLVGTVSGRPIRGDQVAEIFRTRFELDGRVHLDKADDDVWRDNQVLLERAERTLRYRWRHVVGRACEVALQVESSYRAGGWAGFARPCGPGCRVLPRP